MDRVTPSRLLRIISVVEACTWAALLFGMAAKYGFAPELGDTLVAFAGSAHGVAFIAYLFFGLVIAVAGRWPWHVMLLGGLSAIPPFATLLFDWWVERRGLVPASWHDDSPRAWREAPVLAKLRGVVDWTFAHPITLICIGIAAFLFILTPAIGR